MNGVDKAETAISTRQHRLHSRVMQFPVHPDDIEKRLQSFAKRSDGLQSDSPPEQRDRLDEHIRRGEQRGPPCGEPVKRGCGSCVCCIAGNEKREQRGRVDEDAAQRNASSR